MTQPRDAGTTPRDAGGPPRDAGSSAPDASVCTPDTWGNYAQAWFKTTCDNCHGHAFSRSYSTYNNSKSSIKSRISSGNMPQRKTLSAADKARILQWINCGGPQ